MQTGRGKAWEKLETCSKAAAAGGVTTILCHNYMTKEIIGSAEDLDREIKNLEGGILHADVALSLYLNHSKVDEVEALAADGRAFGFWCSLDPSVNPERKPVWLETLKGCIQTISKHNKDILLSI